MRDKSRQEQREGRPVRDAARAQVVQGEGERVEEQPDHWLWMIVELGWG